MLRITSNYSTCYAIFLHSYIGLPCHCNSVLHFATANPTLLSKFLSMLRQIFFTLISIYCFAAHAQFGNILEKARQKTKTKINQRIDQKMDKAIDQTLDKAETAPKKTNPDGSKPTVNADDAAEEEPTKGKTNSTSSLKSYSKFDFVPGEKIVAAEDYSQDAVGDFPAGWNTNGTGEIVTTNKSQGKYLMTQKETIFYPEGITNLPDNFTLEFDLMCSNQFDFYSGDFVVGFTSAADIGKDFNSFARFGEGRLSNGGGFEVSFHPQNAGGLVGMTEFYSTFDHNEIIKNNADQDKLSEPDKTSTHISIWRQKNRVRVYMDEKKVWDMPKGIASDLQLHSLYFRNNAANNSNDAYYLGNIRLAVGAPDTRSKLLTEGKFVTRGILFDVNSDKIKATSYGAIKDIAQVLIENEGLKVLIVGHTDTDGEPAANLELSKKRARAVKDFISKEFNVDSGRLRTDGKGETQPTEKNSTDEGKANNRRVEFIRQ